MIKSLLYGNIETVTIKDKTKKIFTELKKIFFEKQHQKKKIKEALKYLPDIDYSMAGIDNLYGWGLIEIRIPFNFEDDKSLRNWINTIPEIFSTSTRESFGIGTNGDHVTREYKITCWDDELDLALAIKLDSSMPGAVCKINTLKSEQEKEAAIYEIVCNEGADEEVFEAHQ